MPSTLSMLAALLILHLACEGSVTCVCVFDGNPKQKDALQKVHRTWTVQNLCGVVPIPNGKEGGQQLELYLVPSKISVEGSKLPCLVGYLQPANSLEWNSKLFHDRKLPLLLDLDLTLIHAMFKKDLDREAQVWTPTLGRNGRNSDPNSNRKSGARHLKYDTFKVLHRFV